MAPENTTDSNLPDTVSREAHQRMTDERNDLKAQVETLTSTVSEMAFSDKARVHFAEKGVDDPDWAAKIALPNLLSAKTEIGDVSSFLDAEFSKLYPGEPPAQTDPATPPDDGVPTPDAAQPPGFARPSPAGDGAAPDQKKFTIRSPEVQAVINSNDMDAYRKMVDDGLIEWQTTPMQPG